jgi:hypothetical protein
MYAFLFSSISCSVAQIAGAMQTKQQNANDQNLDVQPLVPCCHEEFYDTFPKAVEEAAGEDFYRLSQEHVDWYLAQGCKVKKVPVPKGGMVLWD